MLKPLVPKFRLDLSARLEDITEKLVPAKLKPIVGPHARNHTTVAKTQPTNCTAR